MIDKTLHIVCSEDQTKEEISNINYWRTFHEDEWNIVCWNRKGMVDNLPVSRPTFYQSQTRRSDWFNIYMASELIYLFGGVCVSSLHSPQTRIDESILSYEGVVPDDTFSLIGMWGELKSSTFKEINTNMYKKKLDKPIGQLSTFSRYLPQKLEKSFTYLIKDDFVV